MWPFKSKKQIEKEVAEKLEHARKIEIDRRAQEEKDAAQRQADLNWMVETAIKKRDQERIEKEAAEKLEQEKRIEAAKLAQAEDDKKRKESDEPWINIESIEVDNNGNIKMKLDWNPAFITYLRTNGFDGDEDRMVQKWVGALYRTIYKDGSNDALNLLDTPGYEDVKEDANGTE